LQQVVAQSIRRCDHRLNMRLGGSVASSEEPSELRQPDERVRALIASLSDVLAAGAAASSLHQQVSLASIISQ